MTGLMTTTPPADYVYDVELATQVEQFNSEAMNIADWADPASADWLAAQGVTHLFVGARGGFLDPAQLSRNPRLQLRFSQAGVFIFALDG